MNDKVRKRICTQKYEYDGFYVSVDKITQKFAKDVGTKTVQKLLGGGKKIQA